ncbi:DUF1697 domain-containing protein [Paenibacillus aestuarii]|uniref:DUF1697 domain-containing protein n=1 Tax=Paenibacillus aestuarii TaxID=516965 RepID=A0ABW0KJS1_9BACL|nr:DUF1697 domain-containing protein [Paenibacillus aestuarii]
MPTYIALLRGINVSGQKMIKMDQLRGMFETMGFQQVITYIQSGNVIFEAEQLESSKLEAQIEQAIKQTFDFDVPVLIRTSAEWEDVLTANPFPPCNDSGAKLYVTLLANQPAPEAIAKLQAAQNDVDQFRLVDRQVYIVSANYGKSKFSNTFIEKKLGVKATTRNWETMGKLSQLAAGGGQ